MLNYYWFFIVQSSLFQIFCQNGLEKVKLRRNSQGFFFLKTSDESNLLHCGVYRGINIKQGFFHAVLSFMEFLPFYVVLFDYIFSFLASFLMRL